jgi:hypothetical protein
VLRESDNRTEEAIGMDVYITEVNPASEYDIMDLDILEAKSRVGMDVRGR